MDESTIDEKKEYLEKYRSMRRRRLELIDKKNMLISSMENAKAIEYSGMPHASNGIIKDLSDYVVKLDVYFSKILRLEKNMNDFRIELDDMFNSYLSKIEAEVMRKRYIELKNWDTIIAEVHKSRRQIYRYHGTALLKIKIKDTKQNISS